MTDDKYKVRYRVNSLGYGFGTASNEPYISMALSEFGFGDENTSHIIIGESGVIHLYLNKLTFNRLTGIWWNGSSTDVPRLKSELEGKVFEMDLGLQPRTKLHDYEGLVNTDRVLYIDNDNQ
ncbi:hypothetical protein J4221_01565 [Candidatus Pacearchaeota archaeon]|nr:hypothetical protein [Candidatus Pacearchaeota archaeon]